MGTESKPAQNENSPQHQEGPSLNGSSHGDEGSSDHGGSLAGSDALAGTADHGNQAASITPLSNETDIGDGNMISAETAGTEDLLGDNDLLGAVMSMTSDDLSNVDHTLDQLTTSTDLFEVPALDFHDVLPT